MSEKADMKSILEACRQDGPMDEKLVRGTSTSESQNNDEYCADAMCGTRYVQFSCDNENKQEDKK